MGYMTGYAGSKDQSTPIEALLGAVSGAYKKRREQDEKRDEENRALINDLTKLTAIENVKAKNERQKMFLESKLKSKEKETELSKTEDILSRFGMGGEKGGGLPEGVSVKMGDITFTGKTTAEEKGAEEATKEAFTRAEGIKRATRRLGSIVNQFNKALPAEQKGTTTTPQRISGIAAVFGARTGLKPNPDLLALQDTGKLQLRAILRDMGEGARMSDQDITQNIKVIEQAGLSNEERKAKIKSFMQVAIDSMDEAVLNHLVKDRTTINMLEDFGVEISQGNKKEEDLEYENMLKMIGQ